MLAFDRYYEYKILRYNVLYFGLEVRLAKFGGIGGRVVPVLYSRAMCLRVSILATVAQSEQTCVIQQ